jgi:hypothetical protein
MPKRVPVKPIPNKRAILWIRDGRVCYWCGVPTRLANGNAWDVATKDHVIPRYKGGTGDDGNLVSACCLCNNRRSYEDQKGLPEGSMLGRYPVSKQFRGRLYASNQRRLQLMTEERKKTTKELQQDTERLLKEGREQLERDEREMAAGMAETNKGMAELKLRTESERISFRRTKNGGNNIWNATIYYDALTADQKQELERVAQILADMAHEIKEEETRTIKERRPTKENA